MTETTTIVVALVLVGGAIYVATREEPAAAAGGGEGGGGLCGTVGQLDGKAGAACTVLGGIARKLGIGQPGQCTRAGGTYGWWSEEHGFTGKCALDRNGRKVDADPQASKDLFGLKEKIAAVRAGVRVESICCAPDGTGDPRCADRRDIGFGILSPGCRGPWAALWTKGIRGVPRDEPAVVRVYERDGITVTSRDHR